MTRTTARIVRTIEPAPLADLAPHLERPLQPPVVLDWTIRVRALPQRPGDNDAGRRIAKWLKDGRRQYRIECTTLAAEQAVQARSDDAPTNTPVEIIAPQIDFCEDSDGAGYCSYRDTPATGGT